MKKKNVTLLYKKGSLPENFYSAALAADENDLRLLLSLYLACDTDKPDCTAIAEKLGMSEGELDASIKYWCGAGLIKKGKDTQKPKKTENEKKADVTATAHKEGKLEKGSELPSYSSAELSELIEKRKVTAEFIDEAQRIVGRIFNTHEVGILVGIVDYIGFDETSVIIILSEMIKDGKNSLRYAEKLALALYDMEITTSEGMQAYFKAKEENKKTESLVRSMFGMSGRALSATESRFLNSWITKMEYGVDVIRLAYDITVDNTQTTSPSYANAILKKWHELGLRTGHDVEKYLEENNKKKSKTEKESRSSFDTDDFFDAARRRAFEEI